MEGSATEEKPIRLRMLVDANIQVPLLVRVAAYLITGGIYIACILHFSDFFETPEKEWHHHLKDVFVDCLLWIPGLLLLLPFLLMEMLGLSHRFVGPVLRLRKEMQELSAGRPGNAIRFRSGDQWQELADLYNHLRAELLELRGADVSLASEEEPQAESTQKDRPLLASHFGNSAEPHHPANVVDR